MPAVLPRRRLVLRAPAPAPTPPPPPAVRRGGAPIPDWDWRAEARWEQRGREIEMGRRQDNGTSGSSGGASSSSGGSSSDASHSSSSSSSSSTTTTTSSNVQNSSSDDSVSISTSSDPPASSSSSPSPTSHHTGTPTSSTTPTASTSSGSESSSSPPPPTSSSSSPDSSSSPPPASSSGGASPSSGAATSDSRSTGQTTGTGSTGSGSDSSLTERSTVISQTTHTVIPITTETSSAVVVTNSAGQLSTITSVIGVTLSSTVQTVNVITSTGAALHDGKSGTEAFFKNKGAVAGVFVVVGLAIAAILLGLAFLYVRRRRARELQEDLRVAAGGAGAGGAGVNRVGEDDDDEVYDQSGSRSAHTGGSSWGAGPEGASNHTSTPLMAQYHPSNGSGGLGVLSAAQGYHPGHAHNNSMGSGVHAPLVGGAAAAGAGVGMYSAYNGLSTDSSPHGAERESGGSYYPETPHDSYGYPLREKGTAPGDYDPTWSDFVASGVPVVYQDDGDAQARASGDSGEGFKEGRYRDNDDDVEEEPEEDSPVPVDQRLDPRTALLALHEEHGSLRSLRDHEDYSRKILKIANPADDDEE